MVVQRAHWVQQQAMKECGTVIRIDLDFKNAFNSAGHSCLWAILRGLGVPDVDFLEELYSKSWMRITVGTGCSAPIQLDTGTVQGSVLSPLLFDLFLNALLRLLDATGITHGIKRTPQWNHATPVRISFTKRWIRFWYEIGACFNKSAGTPENPGALWDGIRAMNCENSRNVETGSQIVSPRAMVRKSNMPALSKKVLSLV